MPDLPSKKHWGHPRQKNEEGGRSPLLPSHDYAELLSISNFSFLRGASHPEELVTQAAALGYRAIGVCDINTLAGVVRAHIAAKRSGIKLLIGSQLVLYRTLPEAPAELTLTDAAPHLDEAALLPFSLVVYPKNRAAYGKLSRLLSLGKLRAPKGECYLTLDDLPLLGEESIVIIVLQNLRDPTLSSSLEKLSGVFPKENLFFALWNSYGTDQVRLRRMIEELSNTLGIQTVVTNNALYHSSERRELQDILSCIRNGTTLQDAGYLLSANDERYLKPPAELYRLFRTHREALKRTITIADQISFSFDQIRYEYPPEICPDGRTPSEYLRSLTLEGAAERYPQGIPKEVRVLLEYEFQLISELQYECYFLTVYDIVRFARSQGILCQGRGAAANSAVCFCLGITAVDPEHVRLLLERFISKERNEPPDIDIDFEHERREEVIQYIYNRFGRERAALVCEVITYRSRSAVRDVGKCFSLSVDLIELLSKVVTRLDGEPITPELIKSSGLDPENIAVTQTLRLTQILKGFPRHLSQHVGGFIITAGRLDEVVPIENAGMERRTVIEWDKDDIEALGMLKIDILALGMLTAIRRAFDLLNQRLSPEQTPYALHRVPKEDPAVYEMLCEADSVGVFQVESRAQMSMLPRLRPRCFYDLVIEVAIVRPGPIQGGMVHPFLRRRNGEERVSYPDSRIEAVLGRTLGVPIFQEQAMELAVVGAGFTPGEADELRRAMASWKRNKNALHAFKDRIIQGMKSRGYTREFAECYFQQIQGFGEYGFPQSHAASFALLVYVSSWLKRHHPAAFCAALLNSQPMGFYQPAQLVDDAKRHGVVVRPIDINESDWDCTLEGGYPDVRLGMRMIKGIKREQVERILSSRNKRFHSIQDLWRRSGVRSETLRALARADAFSSLGISRQRALWEIQELNDTPLPLFDSLVTPSSLSPLPPLPKPAEVIRDYQSTGLSLKAHPLSFLRSTLEAEGAVTSAELKDPVSSPKGRRVSAAGLVLVRQRPGTAAGVTFITLEDEFGSFNLIVYPQTFKEYRSTLCDGSFLFVSGTVQREQGIVHLLVEKPLSIGVYYDDLPGLSRDFH